RSADDQPEPVRREGAPDRAGVRARNARPAPLRAPRRSAPRRPRDRVAKGSRRLGVLLYRRRGKRVLLPDRFVVLVVRAGRSARRPPSPGSTSRPEEDSLMGAEARIKELGITLPAPGAPVGNYVPGVLTGNLLYLSGHGPIREGRASARGKVGRDL